MSDGDPKKELMEYLRKARPFLLRPLRRNLALMSDKLFLDIKTQISKPPLRERVRGIGFLMRLGQPWTLR